MVESYLTQLENAKRRRESWGRYGELIAKVEFVSTDKASIALYSGGTHGTWRTGEFLKEALDQMKDKIVELAMKLEQEDFERIQTLAKKEAANLLAGENITGIQDYQP